MLLLAYDKMQLNEYIKDTTKRQKEIWSDSRSKSNLKIL